MWCAVLWRDGVVVSVSSLLIMLLAQPLVKNAIAMGRSIRAAVTLLARHDDGVAAPRKQRRHCERCAARGEDARLSLSRSDVEAVMASLGMVTAAAAGRRRGEREAVVDEEGEMTPCGGGCEAMGVVEELAESKVAGEGELREAFGVFDHDEDGFVCAGELWSVMRRLGMEEGARYEDCARMIAAHDGDGDGRICFREFRAMMENAV